MHAWAAYITVHGNWSTGRSRLQLTTLFPVMPVLVIGHSTNSTLHLNLTLSRLNIWTSEYTNNMTIHGMALTLMTYWHLPLWNLIGARWHLMMDLWPVPVRWNYIYLWGAKSNSHMNWWLYEMKVRKSAIAALLLACAFSVAAVRSTDVDNLGNIGNTFGRAGMRRSSSRRLMQGGCIIRCDMAWPGIASHAPCQGLRGLQ